MAIAYTFLLQKKLGLNIQLYKPIPVVIMLIEIKDISRVPGLEMPSSSR